MHHLARERIGIASEKMKTRYNAKSTRHDFREGDKVWLWNPKCPKGLSPKLQTNWEGPYTVLKKLNDVVVQKWECIHDGIRWRIQKCRMQYPNPNGCICPDEEDDLEDWDFGEFQKRPDSLLMIPPKRRKHLVQNEEMHEFLSLKDSKSSGRSRWKRFADTEETFDVKGIEQLFHLLDTTIGNKTEIKVSNDNLEEDLRHVSDEEELFLFTESTVFEDREKRETAPTFQLGIYNECVSLPNGSRTCFDDKYQTPGQWHERKEKLDGMIKKLKQKLEELKTIRKQLKKVKPHKNYVSPELYDVNSYKKTCVCDPEDQMRLRQHLKDERRQRREDLKKERQHRKEEHLKKMERKMRRKTKFENMTCNAEKMNCFTQDNNHWKTPPFWTDGPFCFCQNANNNTFWCLRTINETHNFLYCEFVTGFITYYDLRTDPYQMRNAVYELDYGTLERLRMNLNKLRSCKGSKDCTIRYRYDGPRHQHRQKAAANVRSRPIRLYKEPQVALVIRSNRLRWLGHIWRSPENNQTRAYTFKNPMGSRTRGRPPTRWIDDVKNDLKTLNIKNWQRVAAYRWNWTKRAVEVAKTCNRLLRL
ncbi:extracellular sulfatase Sulf-1 [Trichonephila clavipes]|nr:extracellular sulfatase Sulf-1 [Trichonephila clavipes]